MLKRLLKYGISFLALSNCLLVILAYAVGCGPKISGGTTLNDTQLVTDYFNSQIEVNTLIDIMSSIGGIGIDRPSDASFLPTCSSVTFDTTATSSNPNKSILVDFTNDNCLNSRFDNQYRRGQIYITWQGRLRDVGNYYTIYTHNYYVNNNRHGTHITVTTHGQDASGYYMFTYTAIDTIDYANTNHKEATLQYSMTKRFQSGYYTVTPGDNVYSLTGTNSGHGSQGYSYNVNIDTPMLYDNTCLYRFISGLATFTPNGYSDRTLVFKNGNKCVNNAALLIDGGFKNVFIRQ